MIRPLALALATVLGAAPPALADTAYEMRATYETQAFSWNSPSTGGKLDYTAPMVTYTVVDHTGALFGAAMSVAQTQANKAAAEREAIRKGDRSYTYQVEEARAREGTRFGFTVGQGGLTGASNVGAAPNLAGVTTGTSRMARISLDGDVVEALGGVFVFDTSIAYWTSSFQAVGATNATTIEAWNWPLGLRYRWAPSFLPGLVIEPLANFDWLVALEGAVNGRPTFDARNVAVEVGYHVLPQVKLRAGYAINRLAHNRVSWMDNREIVDMRNVTLGATMFF